MNNGEQKKFLQNSTEKKSEIPAENQNNQNSNQNQKENLIPENLAPLNSPTTPQHPMEASTPIVEPPRRSYVCNTLPEPELNTGHGFRARLAPGAYRRLNQGLDANTMLTDDLEDDLNELGGADQYNLAKTNFGPT